MKQTLLLGALVVLGQLPLPLLHGLGWLGGWLLWLLPNRYRAITLRHLELCFPERTPDERAGIARRSLAESCKAVCEAPAIWFGAGRRLRHWIGDAEALRSLRAAASGGKGAIILTPHLGAWELASFFAAQCGPITVLYKPQKGAAEAAILRGRSRWPQVRPVPTTGGGVKALLAALRRGELVGILPDHDPPEESGTRFAPFFGIQANTMELVGRLAARTGAPVWFLVAERRPWGRGFRFQVQRAPSGVDDPTMGAAALNQGVEACVARQPEQYWWSYKRFRRRPPGASDLYQNL
ncbi:MAG: lysophospholipid acyltransferase family protein [Nevskia sp.]|nr:lysophospholipid acyltransferase family protein [Nevskia sp.]